MGPTARIGFVSRSREAFLQSRATSTGFCASPENFRGEAQNGNREYRQRGFCSCIFTKSQGLNQSAHETCHRARRGGEPGAA
jgi:hypothetical protein